MIFENMQSVVKKALTPEVGFSKDLEDGRITMAVSWYGAHVISDITPIYRALVERDQIPIGVLAPLIGSTVKQLCKFILEDEKPSEG